jgi:signal transduction histidine kinase
MNAQQLRTRNDLFYKFLPVWVVLAAIGGLLVAYDFWTSDSNRAVRLTTELSVDLQAEIHRLTPEYAYRLLQKPEPNVHHAYSYVFDSLGRLVEWSTNQYVPQGACPCFSTSQQNECHSWLEDRDRLFYRVCHRVEHNRILVFLLPIQIKHPIRNAYLTDIVFAGRYADWFDWLDAPRSFDYLLCHARPSSDGNTYRMLIKGQDACPLYIRFEQLDWLRWPYRLVSGLCIAMALVGLLVSAWLTNLVSAGVFWLLLTLLRWGSLALGLPRTWVTTELFSAQLLALDNTTPSLGDLLLTVAWAIMGGVLLLRWLQHLDVSGCWNRSSFWYTYGFWFSGVAVGAGLALAWDTWLRFLQRLFLNATQLQTDFSDLMSLDLYTVLLFVALALIVWMAFQLTGWCYSVLREGGQRYPLYLQVLALSFGYLVGLAMVGRWSEITLWQGAGWSSAVGGWLVSRWNFSPELAWLRAPLPRAGMAFLLLVSLVFVQEANRESQFQRLIRKLNVQRDFITEYTFDERVHQIREDSLLLVSPAFQLPPYKRRQATEDWLFRLVNVHLLPVFKSYDVRVYLYSTQTQERLDQQMDRQPFPFVSLKRQLMPTLSSHFFMAQGGRGFARRFYVGRFTVGQRITVQVELLAKTLTNTQFYPTLLMDESVRQRLVLPSGVQLGVYDHATLTQTIQGFDAIQRTAALPYQWPDRPQGTSQISSIEGYNEYVSPLDEHRFIVLRAPKRTLLQNLTTFSLFFYSYLLAWFVFRLRKTNLKRLRQLAQTLRTSFQLRIQLVLLVLTLTPSLIFWLLTSTLFVRYFHQEIDTRLMATLTQTTDFLENNTDLLRDLTEGDRSTPTRLFGELEALLAYDVNVFDVQGQLVHTTRPRLYTTILSGHLNPMFYRLMQTDRPAYRIQQEWIGSLKYFSGYKPLLNSDLQVVGYVQIPFLVEQDAINNQLDKFIAYLLNGYVLLIFLVLIVGYVLSRSLVRPLELLRTEIEQAGTSVQRNPIQWAPEDEIGGLIAAYNRMLTQLDAFEQELARNQRDLAWREMARQVAHEIKNPLTPMKLRVQVLQRDARNENTVASEKVLQVTEILLRGIEQLTQIASNFSNFGQLTTGKDLQLIDCYTLLRENVELYQQTTEALVTLNLADPPMPPLVRGDRTQLNIVFGNLIKNSLQAMAQKRDDGLENEVVVKAVVVNVPNRAQPLVRVQVQDNGTGVPLEVQHKIFEPQFSTKSSGMGLGLAITRTIIESMGGQILFESEPGAGTTFTVELPLVLE